MATKMKSTLLTMSIILFIIAAISAGTLAYMNEITKEPIAKANKQKKIDAFQKVLPKFDNSPIDEMIKIPIENDTVYCYVGRLNGKITGVACESFTNKGFGGRFTVMVGFDTTGNIVNTVMLEHHETPGLGDKADKKKSNWSDLFNGKNPKSFKLKVKKDGGDVDQMSGATITSRAYTDAVQNAYNSFLEVRKKIKF